MIAEVTEEVRKIQLTGRSSYIISLPKKWILEMGLKAGDRLTFLKQNDSTLLLTPPKMKKREKPEEVTIFVSSHDNPYTIMRRIIAFYLVGYNLIRLKTKEDRMDSMQRSIVKDGARRKLVGTEVVSDSSNEMALQVLLSYPELSIESALRRMCIIATSMHEDAMKSLEQFNHQLAKEVIGMDDEVDRFSFYAIRQLKSAVQSERIIKEIGLNDARDCLGYRLVTKSVERIADHAADICENILMMKTPPSQSLFTRIFKMSSFSRSIFEGAFESLFKKDYERADQVIEKARAIELLEKEALAQVSRQKLGAEEISCLRLIIESLHRVTEYSSDVAEVVLNLTVSEAPG